MKWNVMEWNERMNPPPPPHESWSALVGSPGPSPGCAQLRGALPRGASAGGREERLGAAGAFCWGLCYPRQGTQGSPSLIGLGVPVFQPPPQKKEEKKQTNRIFVLPFFLPSKPKKGPQKRHAWLEPVV